MKSRSLFVLFALAAPLAAVPVFIGTNTGGRSESKGIYRIEFDEKDGRLGAVELAAEYRNPGFLALHPTKPLLYACGQPKTAFADGTDSVAGFSIGSGGALGFLGEASSGGKGACHVAVDGSGRTLAVANYGDGTFATVRLDEAGKPLEPVSVIANQGSGPNKNRQERPHAHGVYFDKANARLFVPDLGLDRVHVHSFDAASGKLGPALAPWTTAPGAGPRHLAFSADEKNAYVINELDNTIAAFTAGGGSFEASGTVPTLADGFEGGNTTAEVEVHPNGRFVYGSNRGEDTLVVFRRLEDGRLEFVQRIGCGGKTPRHFKIAPGGRWLLCAHQASNTLRVLPLDPETGRLGEPGPAVEVPSPICILFPRPAAE